MIFYPTPKLVLPEYLRPYFQEYSARLGTPPIDVTWVPSPPPPAPRAKWRVHLSNKLGDLGDALHDDGKIVVLVQGLLCKIGDSLYRLSDRILGGVDEP